MRNEKTLVKTVTFGLTHITVAFAVVYALTGSVVIGGAVALIEPMANTLAYFFHEKIWQRLGHRQRSNGSSDRLAAGA